MQNRIETIPLDNPDERELIIVVSNFDRKMLEYPDPTSKKKLSELEEFVL